MTSTVASQTRSGAALGSSPALETPPPGSPSGGLTTPPGGLTTPASPPSQVPDSCDEETARMHRRLFRTLDHPGRSLIAIDCGSVPMKRIGEITQRFFADAATRETHNLVLAIPTGRSFADSPTFDFVESIKHKAFENHLDGKVSWLLVHQGDTELTALANLVEQQGGQWHGT